MVGYTIWNQDSQTAGGEGTVSMVKAKGRTLVWSGDSSIRDLAIGRAKIEMTPICLEVDHRKGRRPQRQQLLPVPVEEG